MFSRSFPDGVWFVDLAPLGDGERVPAVVGGSRLAFLRRLARAVETIKKSVRGKRLLIVLDNCEHVLSAAAAIANHLLSVEAIHMLATSREGLGMKVSDCSRFARSGTLGGRRHAVENCAVRSGRLFVDRAQLVVHDFTLTDANGAAVADICRRLDGIPLAIELAAGRVRVLSAEQIRAKLNDRFRLLPAAVRLRSPGTRPSGRRCSGATTC